MGNRIFRALLPVSAAVIGFTGLSTAPAQASRLTSASAPSIYLNGAFNRDVWRGRTFGASIENPEDCTYASWEYCEPGVTIFARRDELGLDFGTSTPGFGNVYGACRAWGGGASSMETWFDQEYIDNNVPGRYTIAYITGHDCTIKITPPAP